MAVSSVEQYLRCSTDQVVFVATCEIPAATVPVDTPPSVDLVDYYCVLFFTMASSSVDPPPLSERSFEEQQLAILKHPLLPFVLRAINDINGELDDYIPPASTWENQDHVEPEVTEFLLQYIKLIELQNEAVRKLQEKAVLYCSKAVEERIHPSSKVESSSEEETDIEPSENLTSAPLTGSKRARSQCPEHLSRDASETNILSSGIEQPTDNGIGPYPESNYSNSISSPSPVPTSVPGHIPSAPNYPVHPPMYMPNQWQRPDEHPYGRMIPGKIQSVQGSYDPGHMIPHYHHPFNYGMPPHMYPHIPQPHPMSGYSPQQMYPGFHGSPGYPEAAAMNPSHYVHNSSASVNPTVRPTLNYYPPNGTPSTSKGQAIPYNINGDPANTRPYM